MQTEFTLISHRLCPYVQRAVIALTEKGVPFSRIDVDLADKPDWFKALSPLGKVPLLRVSQDGSDHVIFESAVILEYLEDTQPDPLHPADPLDRAQHRAWIEFASAILAGIARLYSAASDFVFQAEQEKLTEAFRRIEDELQRRAAVPFFEGPRFTLVDAAFGPVFRYFEAFEAFADLHILGTLPRVATWRKAISKRASVRAAVAPDYPDLLRSFLMAKQSVLSDRIAARLATAEGRLVPAG